MRHLKYWFCGILLSSFVLQISSEGCEIDPFIANAPLIVRPENTTIIYPRHGERTITFETGETVEFACPRRQVLVDGTSTTLSVVEATCISNARFRVNGERFLWRQVTCNLDPIPTGRYLNSNCGTNARLAEIGFELGNSRFLRTITICFDDDNQIALYSYYELSASTASRDSTTPRPQFWQDPGFYNIGTNTVNQLYVRASQRHTINGLIGLSATDTKYIDNGNLLFLARGHLTARSDFIYGAEQNATFKYINAAPQWQSFNGQNWNVAEINTRAYANSRNVDLQVWTGTYGVATLPHEVTGEDVPLSLYVDGNIRGLPVPAIFWKIVYNPANRQGVVLIGLNNPYEDNVSKHIICPDISSSIHWLTWKQDNIREGYSYACTVSSFRKAVPYAPNLSVSGCTFDINNLKKNHPLFLSLNNDVIYPEPTTSTIIFKNDEEFKLDCPGTGKVQVNKIPINSRTVLATCIANELIHIGDLKININDVHCSKRITGTARLNSNICWKKFKGIEVGFELPQQKFFRLFTSCFDDISRNVVYTTFRLTKEIGQKIKEDSQPGWKGENFYNLSVKVDKIYPKESHRATINRRLGLSAKDTTFIKNNNYYLAKGHLVARTDFVYDCEQQATFFYVNCAPQWQTFNNGNWKTLENRIRKYAAEKYVNLIVYTGTYGVTTLPHQATGKETKLYLFEGEREGPVIPIPELFWKVAYDPKHRAGVAVLGVNNPYQTNLTNSIICKDISKKISWLNFEIKKVKSGYMYACTVSDLRRVIKYIPMLRITKLLTD